MTNNYLSVVSKTRKPRFFFFGPGGASGALFRARTFAAECCGRMAVWKREGILLADVPEIGEF